MKYIRTKSGEIFEVTGEFETHYVIKIKMGILNHPTLSNISKQDIVKQADNIKLLTMKDDLVFYKDPYCGINARIYPLIVVDDADKCSQLFEKEIIEFYIKLDSGDYHKVAERNEEGVLCLI